MPDRDNNNERTSESSYQQQRDAYDDRWRSWLRGSSTGMDIDGRCINPRDSSCDSNEREEC